MGFDGVVKAVRATRLMDHEDVKNLSQLSIDDNVVDISGLLAAQSAAAASFALVA